MSDKEIDTLRTLLKCEIELAYNPNSNICLQVVKIAPHIEEGGYDPCAIFANGEYAALYNAPLSDFVVLLRLGK